MDAITNGVFVSGVCSSSTDKTGRGDVSLTVAPRCAWDNCWVGHKSCRKH